MFEGSLVESTSLLRSRNRWPAIASVGVQAALAAVLVAIPLMHPEVIALTTPHMTLYAPAMPRPIPPPPPVHLVHVETISSTAPTAPSPVVQTTQLIRGMTSTNPAVDEPQLAVGLNLGPAQPHLPTFAGSGSTGSSVVVASPASGTRTTGKPLPVSTGVLAGMLLEPIRPVYPSIARISRTEGDVIVQAVISRTGHIESAHVISGNAMLQGSAIDAVRAARYKPYLLNGEPTEVETTITIHFHLGG